jgi:hypothetical protein
MKESSDIKLFRNSGRLKQKPLIASGDAIILDACDKWFNLVRTVIEENIGRYPYIDICPRME